MAISPEAAESFRQRRNLKRVLIIVVIGIILSVYWDNNNQYVPSNDSSTTPTIENSWSIPAGYTAWDGNVAYKYVDNPNCTYSDTICVAINVVT